MNTPEPTPNALDILLDLRSGLLNDLRRDPEEVKTMINDAFAFFDGVSGAGDTQWSILYAEKLILTGNHDLALIELASLCEQLRGS